MPRCLGLAQRGTCARLFPRHASPDPLRWAAVRCSHEIWCGSRYGRLYAMRREILYAILSAEGCCLEQARIYARRSIRTSADCRLNDAVGFHEVEVRFRQQIQPL